MSTTKRTKPFTFVSIPPHTMLPCGQMTQKYHLFFRTEHCPYYTLGEAKRQLAAQLHQLKDHDRYFIQWQCIPNCPIWKTAETVMEAGADKAVALTMAMVNDQLMFRDHDQALMVQDAMKAISAYLRPAPPLHNRQN